MAYKFKNVLLCEPRVDIRSTLREALKSLEIGFATSVADVREAWEYLETAEALPGWIITAPCLRDSQNAFHLLAATLQSPEFSHIRVSMVLDKDELGVIPAAYELGLISHHVNPLTQAQMATQLGLVMQNLHEDPKLHCLTAAKYLREFLTDGESFDDLVKMETALLRRFPKNSDLFFKLAEAQYLNEDLDGARRTLKQAELLGTSMQIGVKQIRALLGDDETTEKTSFAASLDFASCDIVDPDETSSVNIKILLEQMGFTEINEYTDGATAAAKIEETPPDLVLAEWRIPGLSGPAFVQRLKGSHPAMPVVIVSSLVKKSDWMLLKELGSSGVIEKPVTASIFLSELGSIMRQEFMPTDVAVILRKMMQALDQDDVAEVDIQYTALKSAANVPTKVRLTAETFYNYAHGRFPEAKQFAIEGLREDGEDVVLLNLLGKICLKLGDTATSIKVLERANGLSGDNVERLCVLAEAKEGAGDSAGADANLAAANSLDSGSQRVQQTSASINVDRNNVEKAAGIAANISNLGPIVSYMNNRGVALTQSNELEKALKLYQNALKVIPADQKREKALVMYNISLAYIRMGDQNKALEVIRKTPTSEDRRVDLKITALRDHLENAAQNNSVVRLQSGNKNAAEIKSPVPVALHAGPGDIGLHLIYNSGSFREEKFVSLVAGRKQLVRRPR